MWEDGLIPLSIGTVVGLVFGMMIGAAIYSPSLGSCLEDASEQDDTTEQYTIKYEACLLLYQEDVHHE